MNVKQRACRMSAVLAATVGLAASAAIAGNLDPPPGPPTSTMKTLNHVDPRIPINDANTPGLDVSTPMAPASIYWITEPGSYYLTEDLVGEAGKFGLYIDAEGVSVDLMGFTVQGVPDSEIGVYFHNANNVSLRNGVIRDWGAGGFGAGGAHNVRVKDIRTQGNGGTGISSGRSSIVTGCSSVGNEDQGIRTSDSSIVSDCVSRENGFLGIIASDGSIITRCVGDDNGGPGIQGVRTNIIADCAARDNDQYGIATINLEVMVLRCVAARNGWDGILATSRCYVRDNICDDNGQLDAEGGAGIRVNGLGARVESNHCTDNVRGIRGSGSGSFITKNTCTGSSSANWDLPAGHYCLAVFVGTTIFDVEGSVGGVFQGSSNAWTNWTH